MKSKVFATSRGCSSDEIVRVLQQTLNDLYLPDSHGNYKASNEDEAKNILYGSQQAVYGFMKNLVHQMEEDEALAMLAEVDHRLNFHDPDFKFEYGVPNTGRGDVPYTLIVQYGDPGLGFVKISVNDTTNR